MRELREILINTDNNVYHPGVNRSEWYESQYILFRFCEFIENVSYRGTTNKMCDEGESEPKHIKECKLLINAINYIQESINSAEY